MPRLSIAQRLALLVAGVALVMTVAICLLSFLRGRSVLADHVTADLADKCNLRMFEVREEFRFIAREVRDSAAAMPKPADGQAPAAYVSDGRFDAAWHELFARLLRWADEHGRSSAWSWVDRDIFLETYFLAEGADGGSRVLKALRREDGGVTAFDPDHEPPLAQSALADVQTQVRAAGKRKAGQPRQFTSQVRPCRDTSHRWAACIGYELAAQPGQPGGLLVVAIDFTRMIANETRHSPRHLFFVVDKDGTYVAHPDPAKVGTRIQDDRGARGKPTFDFSRVPWAADPPEADSERTEGESQSGVTVAGDLHYEIARKSYDRGSPFSEEAQRAALERDLNGLAGRDLQFRFTRPRADSRFFAVSTPDPKMMAEATRLVDAHEKAAGDAAHAWDGPVDCRTFAAHIAAFRLGMERAGSEESGETLYLIVTTGLDEIDHDIWRATRWVLWASLLLCVGAAGLALVPARLLTRPLDRIRHAADRLAEGDYAVDLPVGSHTEIGHLARAFRHMAEQIHQRDRDLHDAIARMTTVLRTAADGIITFNERGIIEEWNQAAERIFGYSADEIKGQKVQRLMEIPSALVKPASDDPAGETVRALSRVISTPSMIRQGRRRDGSTFWMEVAFSEVPVGDRRLTTGIFRDVTQRVEDEDRIRHMNEALEARVRQRTIELQEAKGKLEVALQAAQAASQAKDVFVRTVSHELRTPLSAVKGFTELLLNPKAVKLRENPVPTLQKIHSASEYLLTLINDLLDVARYTAGEQIHLNLSEFDLDRFTAGVVEMANPLMKKNSNKLVAEVGPGLGQMRADETRVRQILLNLLSNAAKFTENGTITFKAVRETSDQVVFTVADTGAGMTAEQMSGLFKPFYRVDNSITRKHGGTGLGLSISKLLCERMGGSIAVASEPGRGTTFTVRLPAQVVIADETKPGGTAKAAPESPPLQPNTVLVIDDDAMSREMVQSFLTREGFHVHLASSGDEGVRVAKEIRPSAITLDVMMPGCDGWAVLSALKTDPRTQDIPVIMLTVAEDRTRGFTLGASDYVTKPIDWNRLGEILRKYCAAPASILVVEDDPLQRESVTQALALAGWSVREASDGVEALKAVDAERPAVILLDLIMPKMDGFQFLDELRRRPGGETIPVIVVTAKDLDDADRRRLNGGVAQVLHKGAVSRDELLARILADVCSHVSCPTEATKEVGGG